MICDKCNTEAQYVGGDDKTGHGWLCNKCQVVLFKCPDCDKIHRKNAYETMNEMSGKPGAHAILAELMNFKAVNNMKDVIELEKQIISIHEDNMKRIGILKVQFQAEEQLKQNREMESDEKPARIRICAKCGGGPKTVGMTCWKLNVEGKWIHEDC
jgi:hypothetical protein